MTFPFNQEIFHTRANVKSHHDGRCVAVPQAQNFAFLNNFTITPLDLVLMNLLLFIEIYFTFSALINSHEVFVHWWCLCAADAKFCVLNPQNSYLSNNRAISFSRFHMVILENQWRQKIYRPEGLICRIRSPAMSARGTDSYVNQRTFCIGQGTSISARGPPRAIRGPPVSARGPPVAARGPPVSGKWPPMPARGPP